MTDPLRLRIKDVATLHAFLGNFGSKRRAPKLWDNVLALLNDPDADEVDFSNAARRVQELRVADEGLLVTINDLSRLTGGIVSPKTIRNRKSPMPKPTGKRSRTNLYRYNEVLRWWQQQEFEADIPSDEDEAARYLTVQPG